MYALEYRFIAITLRFEGTEARFEIDRLGITCGSIEEVRNAIDNKLDQ
jgi:hypothetical protein